MTITPLMPVYPRCGVRPVRGEGCYLIGERGERYLDFAAGIAVNALGHGHPHLTKAIQEQAATLMHVSNLYGSPQGEALAKRIEEKLESARRSGAIYYGLHRQAEASMTSIVPSYLTDDHFHFVDGSAGGYARAAESLKAQMAA